MRKQRPGESKPLARGCGKLVAEPRARLALPPASWDEGTDPAQSNKGTSDRQGNVQMCFREPGQRAAALGPRSASIA